MSCARIRLSAVLALLMSSNAAIAAPDAETAKRCLRAAYMVYPYKRPGAVPMNGDRLHFFQQCMAQEGTKSAEAPKRD
ncbi:hypothetical protein [Bradyrhizobium sp. UFLA03-84]|uniref:hypothetical protein n=1 Tax=Bradyrhizobium sp. UFLA03-84 TaxID=418599 RepID=UPI001FD89C3C|nr:hypothetical protein [Bradyrhizobium sp. UFLA03-84]